MLKNISFGGFRATIIEVLSNNTVKNREFLVCVHFTLLKSIVYSWKTGFHIDNSVEYWIIPIPVFAFRLIVSGQPQDPSWNFHWIWHSHIRICVHIRIRIRNLIRIHSRIRIRIRFRQIRIRIHINTRIGFWQKKVKHKKQKYKASDAQSRSHSIFGETRWSTRHYLLE